MWHRGVWGKRQHMINRKRNPIRKTHQTSPSLCCFALLPAEPDTSFPSLQRWQHLWWVQHNVKTENCSTSISHWRAKISKINLRDKASITECLFTHTLLFSLFIFFPFYFSWQALFFSLSLHAKWLYLQAQSSWMLIWLVHMNTIQGKHLCFSRKNKWISKNKQHAVKNPQQ